MGGITQREDRQGNLVRYLLRKCTQIKYFNTDTSHYRKRYPRRLYEAPSSCLHVYVGNYIDIKSTAKRKRRTSNIRAFEVS